MIGSNRDHPDTAGTGVNKLAPVIIVVVSLSFGVGISSANTCVSVRRFKFGDDVAHLVRYGIILILSGVIIILSIKKWYIRQSIRHLTDNSV